MKLIPKQSMIVLNRAVRMKHSFFRQFSIGRSRFSSQNTDLIETQNEYAHYPPIVDMSEEGQNRHFRGVWYDSVKALPAVEQKLHELAIQQKLDLKTYTLSTVPPTYNALSFYNYITRTHIIDSLPEQIANMNVDEELNGIRDTLCETLLNYYCNFWRNVKSKHTYQYLAETEAGSRLVDALVQQCLKKLAPRNDYVFNSTIQQKPRIWSFWWHGGFSPDSSDIDEKNPCFQYEDHASFAIRGKQPLLPILDMKHPLCSTAEVDDCNFHPEIFQFPSEIKSKVACTPGFWPGDPYEYPFLMVLTTSKFKDLTSQIKYFDRRKLETGAAVISSFAYLNAVAMYQGFTPFHDLTYPLVTQTIVTNGQDWNFFIYQLNTVAFHNDVDKKDRRNLCWSSGKLRLFDTIEDGQVKGINDEVFRVLLKLLHNAPQMRENVIMKPYLGTDIRTANEIYYERYLLRKIYSRVPNKMDHLEEIPTWVKIYKLHPDAPPSPFVRLE